MIYPDVPLEKWLERFPELKIFHRKCPHCSSDVSTTQPFLSQEYAGIQKEFCDDCGKKVGCSVAIPRTKKKLAEWDKVLNGEVLKWLI